MQLSDLLLRLANGRLNYTGLIDDLGVIKTNHKPKIIDAINEGLLRLYTRFVIKEKDVIISLRDHITFYHLVPLYSETLYPQSGVEIPYIMDMAGEVFVDDVIKVLAVFDHIGCELPLNDSGSCNSVFTPTYNSIQVPEPETGKLLNVVYQARHLPLNYIDETAYIELPDVLVGALEAYVAYLLLQDMATDDAKQRADRQLGLYESICVSALLTDVANATTTSTTSKLCQRGFV